MRVFTGVSDAHLREEPEHLAPCAVAAEHTHGQRRGPESAHVVGGVGRAAQPHLAVGEAEDEHGRFARDAGRLAVEILVRDEIPDDDDPLGTEPGDDVLESLQREHSAPFSVSSRPSAHSTASRRSSATWSGLTVHS